MKLSTNFWLYEFTRSQEATRRGIDNNPNDTHLSNMKSLCENLLEKIRANYNKDPAVRRSVFVSSGYRSPALNRAINGSSTSQHCNGEAADIEIFGISNYDMACWIRDNCEYDQLILEFHDHKEGPASGWVHVSFRKGANRRYPMTAKLVDYKVRYYPGIILI